MKVFERIHCASQDFDARRAAPIPGDCVQGPGTFGMRKQHEAGPFGRFAEFPAPCPGIGFNLCKRHAGASSCKFRAAYSRAHEVARSEYENPAARHCKVPACGIPGGRCCASFPLRAWHFSPFDTFVVRHQSFTPPHCIHIAAWPAVRFVRGNSVPSLRRRT